MPNENLRGEKKPVKVVHKKRLRNALIVIMILFVIGCVWKAIRKTGRIPCGSVSNPPAAAYSENDAVRNAIALSYLVYGCDSCDALSGTVSELIEAHDMGILKENFGIKRTDPDNPSSALFDTSDYISRFVGDYRFLCDRKDEKCGFYGAAFCDDRARCCGSHMQVPCPSVTRSLARNLYCRQDCPARKRRHLNCLKLC